jgi:hypothetical protein
MRCPYCKGTANCEENAIDTAIRLKHQVQKRLGKEHEVDFWTDRQQGLLQVQAWPFKVLVTEDDVRYVAYMDGHWRQVSEAPTDVKALAQAAYKAWRRTGTTP